MATFDAAQANQVARAWQELGPDDDEVRFAVTRIGVRLRRCRSRRGSSAAAAVCGVVLGGAALAYAAQAGLPWIERVIGRHAASAPITSHAVSLPVVPPAPHPAASPIAPAASETPAPNPSSSENTARPGRASSHRRAAPSPRAAEPTAVATEESITERASWRLVDEALSEGDDARAKDLLDAIVRTSPDAHTRAAARLGLAQLHAGRGECAQARQIALSVAAEPGVSMTIARRAQRVLSACFAR